jgi:hypothetical protein
MNINFKKLKQILETKTNKAIDKLDELKCTSDDYKILINAITLNLETINFIKKFDNQCENCANNKQEVEEKVITDKNNNIENPIGKKWKSFKDFKEENK